MRKEEKHDLINKLKGLEHLTVDERSYLIDLLHQKKYGLVWEDKPEDVEEQLRLHLPVLEEVVEKGIVNGEEHPNHILIEGDNLHALTALTFTHESKIDVIYIDPPYNTGNKDFKYNDSFVDREDSYRHSKWLSFMHKRLEIAKRLLSNKGVIFISIDDNEQAQLKLLCDEIFGQDNFLNNIIWQKKYSPQNDAKFFSDNHDFVLVYKQAKFVINQLERTELQKGRYTNRDNDERGVWKPTDFSVKTYSASNDYPITLPSGRIVNPPASRCWVTSQARFEELKASNRIWFGANGDNVPALKKFLTEVKDGTTPLTIWTYEEVGHNQSAKQEMKSILHDIKLVFDTPKPVKLIERILKLSSKDNKDFIILDFFAGSGTTLHATMQLNAEDGGNRQCILVTNNENNICEEVTYERNKRVIQGYTNSKGQEVPGLKGNNLRYYKSSFVPSNISEPNKRLLTLRSTELLCIKEDCYTELTGANGFNPAQCRLFTNGQGKYMVVVYHSRQQNEVSEQLISYIQTLNSLAETVKLYAFSPEKETLAEDFWEVAEKIEAIPLPDAIYNAYRATFRALKLDIKAPATPKKQVQEQATEATLFATTQAEA